MNSIFQNEVSVLPGVGDQRAKLLAKDLGIVTYEDLLYHLPFRYIDRTKSYTIAELRDAEDLNVQFRGKIASMSYVGEGFKKRFKITMTDDTGTIELLWFKGGKWVEKRLDIGREYIVFGKVSLFRGEPSMTHPEVETVEKAAAMRRESNMEGVYSSTDRLSGSIGTKGIYRLVCNLWPRIQAHIEETLPAEMMAANNLLSLREALYNVHFPQSQDMLQRALYRLKFEELLGLQLNIQSRRTERFEKPNGFIFKSVGKYFNKFYAEKLPFELTGAQKRVIKEVRKDTLSGFQMNRLLQGDVGSGKTMVAFCTMLFAVDNGFQACIMAPTEILARQHYASMVKMADGLGLRIGILTGASKAKERRESLAGALSGEIDILVGTHALLENTVQFANLGFVVIDEQHRFGVEQRARLWGKNEQPPHILVMTATPIPRTLAMTLYGDLDVSIIDELPPGRKPIRTFHYMESARGRLQGFIKDQIGVGRQVYIVYPLIGEKDKEEQQRRQEKEGVENPLLDYKDLTEGYQEISAIFPPPEYSISICHGKMKQKDKDESMRQFKDHESQIMVATTVIEVGVDVPNATLIIIESAERFGLSQLHQLRGRVGRGSEQSFCILMTGHKLSSDSRQRMKAMCETNDGFRLSELDLKLRGAGDINGTMQSGEALSLRVANPTCDVEILTLTRDLAVTILDNDPHFEMPQNSELRGLKERFGSDKNHDFSQIS
ncbi:MAG: ATP-dependent DNA helicase RecG [Rikenellaceae bacterium]